MNKKASSVVFSCILAFDRSEALDLGANRLRDLHSVAGLSQHGTLRLGGDALTRLDPVSGLRRLDLSGNAARDFGWKRTRWPK